MTIYTDGSCKVNPGGPGGFAVVVLDDDGNLIETYSEACAQTTNNREEIKAILWAFLKYSVRSDQDSWDWPQVYTDSAYCLNTFNSWMYMWAGNNWRKSDNTIPENLDLIKPFYTHWQNGNRIILNKVKGHSTNQWNNLADKLAKEVKI